MMDVVDQKKLIFKGVDFIRVNFRAKARITVESLKVPLNSSLTPKVFYPPDSPKEFIILWDITIEHPQAFNLFVVAMGKFETSDDIDDQTKESIINFNAPAIMFPYIRSFITTFSTNLGSVTLPIILPSKTFRGKLEEISADEYEATSPSAPIPSPEKTDVLSASGHSAQE